MGTKTDALLALAERGWHLFPLRPGKKKDALVHWAHAAADPSRPWDVPASSDPAQIQAWTRRWPDANWGVATGPSGLLVVDLDVGRGTGADGKANWGQLAAARGAPATLQVETPSGGRHLYFKGRGRTTASVLAPGVDTRGVGGMVVIPPSRTDAGAYAWDTAEAAIADAPAWLLSELTPREAAPAEVAASELDTPDAVARAAAWLTSAEPAVEGAGGDSTTYRVACRVRDMGLTAETCGLLMTQVWNPRCSPPWDPVELAGKVGHAYTYARRALGADSPSAMFEVIDDTPEERGGGTTPAPAELPKKPLALLASTIDLLNLPARQWVLGHRLIRGFITLTLAPGGVGKSSLTLLEAIAVATGEDLTGDKVHHQGAVWVYNTEDPMDELQRRIAAACIHHSVPLGGLKNLHTSSGRDAPLVFVDEVDRRPFINIEAVRTVVEYIRKHNIVLLVLDPFVRTHRVDENDNRAIDLVALTLSQIASLTGCAVSVVHHSRKGRDESTHGDMDQARGASALVSAARIAHTVGAMGPQVAKTLGISDENRHWYVRLDDAKANLAPPASKARWFKKVSIQLPNKDFVGTLEISPLGEQDVFDGSRFGAALVKLLEGKNRGQPLSLKQLCRSLSRDPHVWSMVGDMGRLERETSNRLPLLDLDGQWSLIEDSAGRLRVQWIDA